MGHGKLVCEKGKPGASLAGATITFTGSGVRPNEVAKTDKDGDYYMSIPDGLKPGTYNVQAHFSGATRPWAGFGELFFSGSDSAIVTFDVGKVPFTALSKPPLHVK
jgi:hypothetical protein